MQPKEEKIITYFSLLKETGRLVSSYLFAGDDLSLVVRIAQMVICADACPPCSVCGACIKIEKGVHPDVRVIAPGHSTIKIDTVRQAQQFLYRKPFEAQSKVLIIHRAQQLTPDAAHAFLKTVEEPPPNSLIFLLSSRIDLLLPTLISRCRKIYLPCREQPRLPDKTGIQDFLKSGIVSAADRKELNVFLITLAWVLRDYLMLRLAPGTKALINDENCEIIGPLHYTVEDAVDKIDGILNIYAGISNINVNLARNLLRIKFS